MIDEQGYLSDEHHFLHQKEVIFILALLKISANVATTAKESIIPTVWWQVGYSFENWYKNYC